MRPTAFFVAALATFAWSAGSQATWTRLAPTTSPSARWAHAMAYDAARGRIVVFGGEDGRSHFNDTWEWDGQDWTRMRPARSPSVRAVAGIAYDARRQRILLFGGNDGVSYFNDTWEWDGTNWTLLTPANSPSRRAGARLAYDANRQRVVLFGGQGPGVVRVGDTWEWDGVNWTQRTPANSPPARASHVMVYDAARRNVVMCSGWGAAYYADTWTWDGTNWTQHSVPQNPGKHSAPAMAYDAARQRTVWFGATMTWEWDGSAWTQLSPTTNPGQRNQHRMVYDQARGATILFGGYGAGGQNDTWEYRVPIQLLGSGTPRPGSTRTLTLVSPTDAGRFYQCASSLGTGPIPIDRRRIGLSPDPLFVATVVGALPTVFRNYAGAFSARGRGTCWIDIPSFAFLIGIDVHSAFVVLDPTARSGIRNISHTDSFRVAP